MAIKDSITSFSATISSDTLTVVNDFPICIITVCVESGVTDTLTTITGMKTNQLFFLIADSGDTITWTRGTGNIKGPTATYSLSGYKVIAVYYDGTYVKELLRSPNA